ncbi:flagellin [Priestia megaterium]|nr:flagellin [Priestia megaterium]
MYLSSISTSSSLSHLSKLNATSSKLAEGLASGSRINRASDDVANSAINERMVKQLNGLRQGSQNSKDGVAFLRVFEDSLSNMENILQRMRELSLQAANGTYTDSDRKNLDSEFQKLGEEINRMSESTRYNGKAYFGSDNSTVNIMLSDDSSDIISVDFKVINTSTLFSGSSVDILNQDNAQTAVSTINNAIEMIIDNKSTLGSYMERMETNMSELNNTSVNLSDARSRIADLDMAHTMSEYTKNEILTSSTISMLNKANQTPSALLKLIN